MPPAARCSATRSSGSSTRSMRSAAASFRRRPTTCIDARRAHSRRYAGRITLATSELTLPFDEPDEEVRPKPDATTEGVAPNGRGVRLEPDDTYEGVVENGRGVRLQPPFDGTQGGPEHAEGPDHRD